MPPAMDNASLQSAAWIDRGRFPTSSGSVALTDHIFSSLLPHLQAGQARPIGHKAIPELRRDLGTVLAGIMRPGGSPVRVQRGKSAGVWKDAEGIKYDRFWRLADALVAADLIAYRKGTKRNNRRQLWGYPGALWPLPKLLSEAEKRQVTFATRAHDWAADPTLPSHPLTRARGIVCEPWRDWPLGMTSQMDAEKEVMAADLDALNALNASVDIRGAGGSVTLHRKFRHSLAFGGRHYGPAYLRFSERERLGITFNGEAAAEVDVKAAQLTLLHGLTGSTGPGFSLPRGDLYALDGIPRAAVKAWAVRTLGRGTAEWPRMSWKPDDPAEVRSIPVRRIKAAMVGRYPFLGDIEGLVPPEFMASVPTNPKLRAKAAGQYITAREAAVVAAAMAYCVVRGVPVLPVFDALIVPASKIEVAREGLEGAYVALAGVLPALVTSVG